MTALADRLAAFVERGAPDECWPFTGHRVGGRYGSLARGGRGDGKVQAHRAAWELTNGPIPDGMRVLHTCDNPPCCNPAHLFLGTQTDNMRDMAAKRRGNTVKLAEGAVEAIRAAYATGGTTQRALAKQYGVTQTHVWRIVQGVHHAA